MNNFSIQQFLLATSDGLRKAHEAVNSIAAITEGIRVFFASEHPTGERKAWSRRSKGGRNGARDRSLLLVKRRHLRVSEVCWTR